MHRLRLPLLVALLVASACPRLLAQNAETTSPAESALHHGTLPNGLTYAVLPHTSPKGDISLRLIVRAGSLDENDDERGFAHFVEHMAFNGTRHFPPDVLRAYFQTLGLRLGADANARTSFDDTQYLLDLPEGRAARLDEAMILLRDYADGIQFAPEEVRKESGVVLSELRARDSMRSRFATELLKTLYGGTRLAERDPIGEAAQIEGATAEKLRAFYARTYRPHRMTVIVVGPVEPTAIVQKITSVFGSMPEGADSIAPVAAPEPPRFEGTKADIVPLPMSKGSSVTLIGAAARPPDTVAGRREEIVRRIAIGILHTRLSAKREAAVSRYGPIAATYDVSPVGGFVHHTLSVAMSATTWADGVQLLETELRRARTAGFSQAEVDEAVAGRLTSLRNRVTSRSSESADRVMEDLAQRLGSGRGWQSPGGELTEATQALQGLSAKEVTLSLEQILPASSLRVLLTIAPGNAPKPERLLAAYTKSAGRALRKAAEAEDLVFNYESFGEPAEIDRRERIDDLDLTLASFANGVRLNVRPSQLEPDRFRLRIVFPVNLSHIAPAQGGIADLAGYLLLSSNLKRQKQTELARLCTLHGVSPQFGVTEGTPVLTLSGPADELPFALKFLTATLSDVDFDLEHYRVALSRYAGLHQNMMLNPHPLALRHAVYAFTGHDDRVMLNPPQLLARVPPADTEHWLINNIFQGPLEIGLIGDFTVDEAIANAAATVGTLKRRRPPPKSGTPLASPTKAHRQEGTAELPASTSLSCVLWPVTLPDTLRDNAALGLATDVLRDRLMNVVREALGLSYSPTARVHRDMIQRDFAYAAMVSTFEPARARQFTEASIKLAARIAEQGVTEGEFNRLREPARTQAAANLRSNGWWLNNVVSVAQTKPQVIADARSYPSLFDELTLADVNRAAQIFRPDKVNVTLLHPAPPKGAGGEAKKAPAKK